MTYYLWINGASPDGRKYRDGDVVDTRGIPGAVDGGRSWTIRQAEPQWDLYAAIEDSSTEPYSTLAGVNLSFEGVQYQPSARVRETRVWNQIPIADLYDIKLGEIADQDNRVRYNAVDTALSVNWWIIVTQSARFEIGQIQGSWSQRQHNGQAFPSGANMPWIGIYNAANEQVRRYQVDEATWSQLFDEITQHDQATGNATDASRIALDALYADGAGDWNEVAAHDAADPAWGYPPTVEIGGAAAILFV